jgi:hypothetical protein
MLSWLLDRAQAAQARLLSRRYAFQKDANISRASPAIQRVLEFRRNLPMEFLRLGKTEARKR